MNATTLLRTVRHRLGALAGLSSLILIAAGSAMAQGTNATGSQARPDSPAQVTPNPKNQQNTSTFKPAKPASQSPPTSTNKAKAEK